MADRYKARVCGGSLAGIAGSNPTGEHMSVSFERYMRRADPSS